MIFKGEDNRGYLLILKQKQWLPEQDSNLRQID